MNHLSRKPPTHHRRLPSPLQPYDRTKQVQESQPKKNLPKMRPPPAPHSNNGELLRVYPFVERPVLFTFGGPGYGDPLQFVALQNKISYEMPNRGLDPWWGGPVEETKYRREEIYELSSEEEMIAAFLDDDLL